MSSEPVIYLNTDFGVKVELPNDWENYTSFYKKAWIGEPTGILDEKQITMGNQIVIRNPRWNVSKPTQDILINIYNMQEWTHNIPNVGSEVYRYDNNQGGVQADEVARNSEYVFSIPSQFTINELDGVQEVRQIVYSNKKNITTFFID